LKAAKSKSSILKKRKKVMIWKNRHLKSMQDEMSVSTKCKSRNLKNLWIKCLQEKHAEIKKAFDTPLAKRSAEQKKLLSDYPNSNVNTALIIQRNAKLNAEFKKYTDEAANIRSKKPPVTSYRVLAETVEKPPQTFRFEREGCGSTQGGC